MSTQRMRHVDDPIVPVVGDLIRQTPETISFGQGMVSFGPPPRALEYARVAVDQRDTHMYQAVEGVPALLAALGHKLDRENRIRVGSDRRIVVTAGANMAFLTAILAITEPGDEVIFPVPYYFNYPMAVAIADCRAVPVPTDEAFQLDIDAIERAITPRTRAVVTISPNNPSGAVYPESALRRVNALCRQRGLYHISDEVYEYFTFGSTPHFSPGSMDDSVDHTISIFSLSKAYGFAGWRIGYMLFPSRLYSAVLKIQDTKLVCPPVISQRAAVGAIETGRDHYRQQSVELVQVREMARHALLSLPEICTLAPSEGALYLLPRIHTPLDSMTVTTRLIREHRVAVVPGSAFGLTEGCYLRLSFGTVPRDEASEGLSRLVAGLRALTGSAERVRVS